MLRKIFNPSFWYPPLPVKLAPANLTSTGPGQLEGGGEGGKYDWNAPKFSYLAFLGKRFKFQFSEHQSRSLTRGMEKVPSDHPTPNTSKFEVFLLFFHPHC